MPDTSGPDPMEGMEKLIQRASNMLCFFGLEEEEVFHTLRDDPSVKVQDHVIYLAIRGAMVLRQVPEYDI